MSSNRTAKAISFSGTAQQFYEKYPISNNQNNPEECPQYGLEERVQYSAARFIQHFRNNPILDASSNDSISKNGKNITQVSQVATSPLMIAHLMTITNIRKTKLGILSSAFFISLLMKTFPVTPQNKEILAQFRQYATQLEKTDTYKHNPSLKKYITSALKLIEINEKQAETSAHQSLDTNALKEDIEAVQSTIESKEKKLTNTLLDNRTRIRLKNEKNSLLNERLFLETLQNYLTADNTKTNLENYLNILDKALTEFLHIQVNADLPRSFPIIQIKEGEIVTNKILVTNESYETIKKESNSQAFNTQLNKLTGLKEKHDYYTTIADYLFSFSLFLVPLIISCIYSLLAKNIEGQIKKQWNEDIITKISALSIQAKKSIPLDFNKINNTEKNVVLDRCISLEEFHKTCVQPLNSTVKKVQLYIDLTQAGAWHNSTIHLTACNKNDTDLYSLREIENRIIYDSIGQVIRRTQLYKKQSSSDESGQFAQYFVQQTEAFIQKEDIYYKLQPG